MRLVRRAMSGPQARLALPGQRAAKAARVLPALPGRPVLPELWDQPDLPVQQDQPAPPDPQVLKGLVVRVVRQDRLGQPVLKETKEGQDQLDQQDLQE